MKKITLLLAAFIFTMGATFAQDNVLLEQEPGTSGFMSTNFSALDAPIYMADDFGLDGEGTLTKAETSGFVSGGTDMQGMPLVAENLDDVLEGFEVYVFEDNNGEPAGQPGDGSEVLALTLDADDDNLDIEIEEFTALDAFEDPDILDQIGLDADDVVQYTYTFIVDIEGANEEALELDGGDYWVVMAPNLSSDLTNEEENRLMYTMNSLDLYGNDALVIDPTGQLLDEGTDWMDVNNYLDEGDPEQEEFKAVNMVLYGDGNLGVEDFDTMEFTHYTQGESLFVESDTQIDDVTVYNLLGQEVASNNVNATSGNVDLGGLSAGVYVTKVTVDGKVKSFKFSKN